MVSIGVKDVVRLELRNDSIVTRQAVNGIENLPAGFNTLIEGAGSIL